MRIWVLAGWGVLVLCGLGFAQTSANPPHADRAVVLKKARTLQLLSQGKVIKKYKIALGGGTLGGPGVRYQSVFRRHGLTNGFSKKLENHRYSVALHYAYYNFCRVHQTLRVTPAMEAKLTDHVWSVEELLSRLDSN